VLDVKNWETIPRQEFHETAFRQVFSGDNVMLVLNTIKPGFPTFAHSHPHEQLLCILEGACEVTLGAETIMMKKGDMIKIPPNVEHDLQVIGEETVVNMDVFTPVREDYLLTE